MKMAVLLFLGSLSAFAWNGGERGGGDIYVAEFNDIRRNVVQKINHWVTTQALNLTPEELRRFSTIEPTVLVFSEERVFLEDAQNGLPARKEVDAINFPEENPPLIVLGRERWKAMGPTRGPKELLVLHELLSVTRIADKTFEKSYSIRLAEIRDWETIKQKHREALSQLHGLYLRFFEFDLSQIDTFSKTVQLTSDYQKCIAASGNRPRDRRDRDLYCAGLPELFEKANQEYLMKNMRSGFLAIAEEFEFVKATYVQKLKDMSQLKTRQLLAESTHVYLLKTVEAARSMEAFSKANHTPDGWNKICPRQENLSVRTRCIFEVLLPRFSSDLDQYRTAAKTLLDQQFKASNEMVNAVVDPLD